MSQPLLFRFSLPPAAQPVAVRSIENADKHPKKIAAWIANVQEVHRQKPPPTVHYQRTMPDIEQLMQVWPQEFEEALKEVFFLFFGS